MRLALTAFTLRGARLARHLAEELRKNGYTCAEAYPEKLAAGLESESYGRLQTWTGEQFQHADGLIFVGACGIVVRAIAPFVKDKFTDPAVVAIDEGGNFIIPLLSGHVGGANDLARRAAALTGGVAVVTTATDINGVFAVDQWAARQGIYLDNRSAAKHISASLLVGKHVSLKSDFPIQGEFPAGLTETPGPLGIWVTAKAGPGPFAETLRLIPPVLNVGIGCRRGIGRNAVDRAVKTALEAHGLSERAVKRVCTVELKKEEPGLLEFCREKGLPLSVYTAEELLETRGSFTGSAFVEHITGVDNVCERAAVRAGGVLIIKKRALEGVTVAVSCEPFTVRFD